MDDADVVTQSSLQPQQQLKVLQKKQQQQHNTDCTSDINNRKSNDRNSSPLPVACIYDETLGLFRLTRSRGKTIASGGYGIVLAENDGKEYDFCSDGDDDDGDIERVSASSSTNEKEGDEAASTTVEKNHTQDSWSKSHTFESISPQIHQKTVSSQGMQREKHDDIDEEPDDTFASDSLAAAENFEDNACAKTTTKPIKTLVKCSSSSKTLSTGPCHETVSDRPASVGEYLFIEEVLVLFEKGLIEVYRDDNDQPRKNNNKNDDNEHADLKQLNAKDLYNLLEPLGVPLPLYLVYAHLRQQTYRVVRHTPTRRALLLEMDAIRYQKQPKQMDDQPVKSGNQRAELAKSKEEKTALNRSRLLMKQNCRLKELRLALRHDAATASPPVWLTRTCFGISSSSEHPALQPAFDVYQPNGSFSRSFPGLPNFSVAVTSYAHRCLTFSQIQNLLITTTSCQGIPLKIATVSESGTVVMFGVTDSGVPKITAPKL